jgi:ribosomal protein S27AE
MWKLKACPHCGGDVFITAEIDGWYEHCLNCGYECELKDIRASGVETEEEPALVRRGRPLNK